MASTYSTNLKIQLMGNGEDSGTWGSITNTNWNLMEQAVSGVQTITMANANYTLTNLNGVSDEARNMVLVVQGTNSGIYQVVAPLNQPKIYVVSNQTTGGYAITIGASSGSVITIPNGVTAQVYTDGTNFYSAQTGSAGNFNVNGTLTASGIADTGSLSVTNNATIGGNLTVTGSVTAGSISGITGRIAQIIQSVSTSTASTSASGSYVTTGHSATITPTSSTSKILVTVTFTFKNSAGYDSGFTIYRGSTNIAGTNTNFAHGGTYTGGETEFPASIQYLDSPATASSTTYTVYMLNPGSPSTLTYNAGQGNGSQTGAAVITLLEISQ